MFFNFQVCLFASIFFQLDTYLFHMAKKSVVSFLRSFGIPSDQSILEGCEGSL